MQHKPRFNRKALSVLLSVSLAVLSVTADAKVFSGYVTRVSDGDTIRVETDSGQNLRIRIQGIDAPESDQEFGGEAQQLLSKLILNREVVVSADETDRYGRSLGQVALEDTDIGLYMLEHGLAWTYRNYLSSMRSDWRNAYIAAEQKAREDGVGLWQSEQPVPPWTWRKQKRDQERALEESQSPEDTLSSVNKELIEKFDNLKDVIAQGEQERPDGKTERGNVEKKVTYWQLCSDLGQAAARWIVTVIKSIFF